MTSPSGTTNSNSNTSQIIIKSFKANGKIDDLLSKALTSLKSKEFEQCEQYINLISLYSPLAINQKIKLLSYKFMLFYISKDVKILLMIVNKYLKFIYSALYESDIDASNKKVMLRQIFQLTEIIHKNKNYYLEYFLFQVLLKSKINAIISDQLAIDLNNKMIYAFKSIDDIIKGEKEQFKNDSYSKYYQKLKKKFIDNKYSFPEEKKENCYIVSTDWIRTFIAFLIVITSASAKQNENVNSSNAQPVLSQKYLLKQIQSSKTSNLFYLYYLNRIAKDEEEYTKVTATFPGPINNYFIISQCDAWNDPDEKESYSNVYLSNKVIEKIDFKYIDQDTYQLLKKCFGVNYEIERKLINDDYYEVYLLKFKILILSPVLVKNNLTNFIRKRNFQISRNKTVKDLKAKIIRCLNSEISNKIDIKKNNLLSNPFFHIINPEFTSESQNEIYNIVNCYYNKYSQYKQKLKGSEITQDDMILENLKLCETDLLIVEIVNQEEKEQPQWFIKLKSVEDYLKCSLCSNPITGAKLTCDNCTNYIYCSEDCKQNDIKHITHHQNLDALYKKKFALHDMLCVDINTIIDPNARHGLTGMKNLGNTCFMNSALQCLSNCEELTKYFLLEKYKEEINKKNKYGSGGEIAKAYFKLIEDLWNGNKSYLNPYEFRSIFVSFVKQFAGFCQHDSHEMLAFMLDALHEDLNRVKTKPYRELDERWENETEEEASLRWWKSHIDRENSIIVDLFHGQFKSVVRCPQCNRVNTIYDPFMHLGLPIPIPQTKIRVKLIIDDESINKENIVGESNTFCNDNVKMIIFYYNCNEDTTVREIKSKLMSEVEKRSKNNLISKMKKISLEGVIIDHHLHIKKYLNNDDDNIMNFYINGYETVFYKIEKNDDEEYFNVYVSPVIINSSKIYPLFYPKVFAFDTTLSIREVYYNFFVYYRKLFKDISNHSYTDFISNKENLNYLNDEFTDYIEVKDSMPFKLHIVNNVPHKAPFSCEYCNRSCDYCPFIFKFSQNVKDMKTSQKIERPFIIYLEVILYSKNEFIEGDPTTGKNFKTGLITKNQDITIYDCLEAFRTEEKLEKENSWYCSTCKSHQEAYKKLEIFRAPNILIVQLKRFKIKNANIYSGMMHNKKNDSLVVFPITNLDLRQYIVEENSRKEGVYDLYAISQHFGNLSSGHYTALCKNGGKWYDFDDERVTESSEANVVSKSAYLLFYRKRNLSQT